MKHIFSKKNRALLSELVRTDFKLRYQGSVLGYAWSLLKPLLLFGILYVVFVKFLRLGSEIPNYPIYLLIGIVFWSFFAEITSMGLTSIVGRGDLIRKIRIPRWIIILSTSISALINLSLNLLIVAIFMSFSNTGFNQGSLLLPLYIVEIYLFAIGVALFLSAAYVKYRDISYVWEVMLQAGFYLTPILYPLQVVKNVTFQKILLLNPLGQAIQDIRFALVTEKTITINSVYNSKLIYIYSFAIIVLILVCGIFYFKKESVSFAENL
jgi:ABC-2 type transport system permease protein